MDVLVTPDVLSYLEIIECTIIDISGYKPYALLAFSDTYIFFISSEPAASFPDAVSAKIRTRIDASTISLAYKSSVKTSSKHWIFQFNYDLENLETSLKSKWKSLLTINQFQQMRKDVRLTMDQETVARLYMHSSEVQAWILNNQKVCVLENLSYSGARIFSTDDFEIDSDDKLILKIAFTSPSEIATIRSCVLRKRSIKIGNVDCLDVAVRFLDPIDLVLLSRLTRYFQENTMQLT